jgi:hypothetical protein
MCQHSKEMPHDHRPTSQELEKSKTCHCILQQGKAGRYRHIGAKGVKRYSSYPFLISAIDGVSGQRHASAAFYPGKGTPVPTEYKARWATELVWT